VAGRGTLSQSMVVVSVFLDMRLALAIRSRETVEPESV
jgi:hypothetical protein